MPEAPAAPQDKVASKEHGEAPDAASHRGAAPDPAYLKRNTSVATVNGNQGRQHASDSSPPGQHGCGACNAQHLHIPPARGNFLNR